MNPRLPRAIAGRPFAIDGAAWNHLCDLVEQAANLTVAAPLSITYGQGGRAISIALEENGVAVKISSIISSQIGRYNGKRFIEAADSAATGNLTEANVGTLPSSDDAVIWHAPEIALGSAKHLLKAGVTYTGRPAGRTSDGKLIVLIGVLPVGETASPTVINPAGSTADSTTWSRATNGTPLTLTLWRTYIDPATMVVKTFTRTISLDACGIPISLTAETQVVTNTGEDCA